MIEHGEPQTRAYVLGAPTFVSESRHERIRIPFEEWEISHAVFEESDWGDVDRVSRQRSREYLSIVRALESMELPFAIFTPSDPAAYFGQPCGKELRRLLQEHLLIHAPDSLTRAHRSYPRDLMHVVNDVWLIHAQDRGCFEELPHEAAIFSELGEGGRVLHAGEYLLHPDAIVVDGETVSMDFAVPGMTCLPVPRPWLCSCDREGPIAQAAREADHLDRCGCMLEDARGNVHLVVNHGLRVREEPSTEGPRPYSREATDEIFGERLAGTPIEYHRAPPSRIPYILNLIQAADGRILMSGGDAGMKGFLESITSREVHTTDTPIRYYPVFSKAGLRCLVGETPRTFFESSATKV